MGVSIVLALLIGRAIRSMPHVPLGARPPLQLPRPQVLVPAALGGALAALAMFALAAPSLDPGVTRSDVANGALAPGPVTRPSPPTEGARDRRRSASRPASPVLAVAAALRTPSDGAAAPAGTEPTTGRPTPGPSGRKRGGGSNGSISLPVTDAPAPTSPAQPPAVSEPTPPAPAAPAPDQSQQVDAGWPGDEVARRPAVDLPSGGNEKTSAPSLPGGREATGEDDEGEEDGHK